MQRVRHPPLLGGGWLHPPVNFVRAVNGRWPTWCVIPNEVRDLLFPHSSLATALHIWDRLGACSVRLRLCSSPSPVLTVARESPVLTGARESTFPQRSPITLASLASHVWGRGPLPCG